MMRTVLTMMICMALAGAATAQERRYDFSFPGVPVERAIAEIEQASGLHFSYPSSLLSRFPAVTGEYAGVTLRELLERVFAARGVAYKLQGRYVILGRGRRSVVVSGTVRDAESRESLIGATVYSPSSHTGTATNDHGFFSLTLEEGERTLVISFVGYRPFEASLALTRDTVIHASLSPSIMLEGVDVVYEIPAAWMQHVQPGQVQFPVEIVNDLPALLGESDVLKTLQLLPGVKTGNEGLAGLYVRGGNADENLYLMDGIPIYNPSHLMGFFSTFNSNVVKRVDFYKGSFPARYGGRLSSVVDTRLKEGNAREMHGNLSVGLLASKFDLEGPLERGKTSFLFSARRTYMDLFLPSLLRSLTMEKDASGRENYSTGRYHFTDVNAKVTRKFSERRQLSLGLYWGEDYMNYANRTRAESILNDYSSLSTEERDWRWGWGNLVALLEYGARINERLYGRYLLSYNRYLSTINVKIDSTLSARVADALPTRLANYTRTRYHSGIEDAIAKVHFEYNATRRVARFGAEAIHHTFTPEISNSAHVAAGATDTLEQEVGMKNRVRGGEFSLFYEEEIAWGRLRVDPGVRLTLFRSDATYLSAEPRLSLQYAAGDRLDLKASYSEMSQYIHLLAFGGVSLPSDLWVPVTKRVRPMRSRQVAAGIYYRFRPGWELTAEGYYKTMANQIECVDGTTILPAYRDWEENVAIGKGDARGVELQLQRRQGKTTGWINYTLAWANRQFPGKEINRGQRFPARNDSRHGVNAVVMHRFTKSLDASAAWVYNSGARATVALEAYDAPIIEGASAGDSPSISAGIPHVEYRNNYALPAYHRLDLGLNYRRRAPRWSSTWSLSIYNVYSRMNPFFVYMSSEEIGGQRKSVLREASLFPVIPSISYAITF